MWALPKTVLCDFNDIYGHIQCYVKAVVTYSVPGTQCAYGSVFMGVYMYDQAVEGVSLGFDHLKL